MVLATRPSQIEASDSSPLWVPGYWTTEAERNQAPSVADILALYREGTGYFSGFHSQCREEDDYYFGRRNVPHPQGIDPVWPATSASIINIASAHVDTNNISVSVPSSPATRARSERMKKYYSGIWMATDKPVLQTAVKQSFLYGISFLKTMFDTDKWPGAPRPDDFPDDSNYRHALQHFQELRNISWPIDVEVISPKNMIWDDSRAKPKWAIEFYRRPVAELQRQFPEWVPNADFKGFSEWIEYWDEEWYCYIAGNAAVWGPFRHGYGYMPMSPILPAHTISFQDGTPHDRFKGILNPIHSLLDEEARLVTQIGTIVQTVSYRTLDFQGPEERTRKVMAQYELWGGKNFVDSNVTVGISPLVQVPQDIGDHLARVQNYIEQATFPNIIRGVRPRGVSAGYGLSILAGMGRIVFQGVADGVRRAVENVHKNAARLVENKVRGRLSIFGRSDVHDFDQTIEPNDIRGMYENTVTIKAEAPEEREREALLALKLMQAGIISNYEAKRRAGILNPLEEMMQQRAEELMATPRILEGQAELLAQQIDLPGQQAESVETAGGGPVNLGNQNLGGAALPRPGEGMIQQGRAATLQGQPSVFAKNIGDIDNLASVLGSPRGGKRNVPSGQTVP